MTHFVLDLLGLVSSVKKTLLSSKDRWTFPTCTRYSVIGGPAHAEELC